MRRTLGEAEVGAYGMRSWWTWRWWLLRRSDDLEQAMVWSRKVDDDLIRLCIFPGRKKFQVLQLLATGTSPGMEEIEIGTLRSRERIPWCGDWSSPFNLEDLKSLLLQGLILVRATRDVAIVQFVIGRCFNSLPDGTGISEEKARVLLQFSSWRQVHIVRQLATFSLLMWKSWRDFSKTGIKSLLARPRQRTLKSGRNFKKNPSKKQPCTAMGQAWKRVGRGACKAGKGEAWVSVAWLWTNLCDCSSHSWGSRWRGERLSDSLVRAHHAFHRQVFQLAEKWFARMMARRPSNLMTTWLRLYPRELWWNIHRSWRPCSASARSSGYLLRASAVAGLCEYRSWSGSRWKLHR